jgi:hypothetical protein
MMTDEEIIMKNKPGKSLPHAREGGMVVKDLPDEVLVYDVDRHRAHCLSQTASLVWKNCNGSRTVGEIAQLLRTETGGPVDEEVVWYALDELGKANLLKERVKRPTNAPVLSRRQILGRFGAAALLSVPLIMSIPVPTAAATATQPCIPEEQCSTATICNPCHTTGSTDCAKRCRPKPGGGSTGFQCVGVPASTCP